MIIGDQLVLKSHCHVYLPTDWPTISDPSSKIILIDLCVYPFLPPKTCYREDVGPWMGSLGAFCGKWGNDDFVTGEWVRIFSDVLVTFGGV